MSEVSVVYSTGLVISCVGTASQNMLLKEMIELRVEVTGRQWRRVKQLLDELKEMIRYWKLTEDALDRI